MQLLVTVAYWLLYNKTPPPQKEIPEVATHFVDNGIDPTGLGEPALPPTGGAIANALFKATGKRLRNQPFMDEEIFSGKKVESVLKKEKIN